MATDTNRIGSTTRLYARATQVIVDTNNGQLSSSVGNLAPAIAHGSINGGTLVVVRPTSGLLDDYQVSDSMSPYVPSWWAATPGVTSTVSGTKLDTGIQPEITLRSNRTYAICNISITLGEPKLDSSLLTQDLIVGSLGLYVDNNNFVRIEVFANASTPFSVRRVYAIGGQQAASPAMLLTGFPITLRIVRVGSQIYTYASQLNFSSILGWSTAAAQLELRALAQGTPSPVSVVSVTNFIDKPMLLSGLDIVGEMTEAFTMQALQFLTRAGRIATTIPLTLHTPTQDISVVSGWTYDDNSSLILASDGNQILSVVGDLTLRQ